MSNVPLQSCFIYKHIPYAAQNMVHKNLIQARTVDSNLIHLFCKMDS